MLLFHLGEFYIPRPDRLYDSVRFRRRPSVIEPATTVEVLAQYGLELRATPQVPPGPGRSHSLILTTSQGKKVLKRYKYTVIVPAIVHEHSILAYLAGVGFPSPRLVATPSGETMVCRDGHHYAMFDFIAGGFQYHNYLLLPVQVRKFIAASGEILASLHDELKDLVPQGHSPNGFRSRQEDWWRDREWYASRLAHCRAETQRSDHDGSGPEAAWLLRYAGFLEEALDQLDGRLKEASLPRMIIHGDYGPYNLLFKGERSITILDFELARLDWRATELVDGLQRFSLNRWGFNLDKMKCFLDAYRVRFAINSDEIQCLPDVWTFLNVRRCIVHWHHYCDTHEPERLTQARWNLRLIDWMTDNRRAFLAYLLV